jgi:hypothetical protein
MAAAIFALAALVPPAVAAPRPPAPVYVPLLIAFGVGCICGALVPHAYRAGARMLPTPPSPEATRAGSARAPDAAVAPGQRAEHRKPELDETRGRQPVPEPEADRLDPLQRPVRSGAAGRPAEEDELDTGGVLAQFQA